MFDKIGVRKEKSNDISYELIDVSKLNDDIDDKLENNHVLNELLIKLGFARLDDDNSEKGGKLFSIFK